jgi:hypothetical protein
MNMLPAMEFIKSLSLDKEPTVVVAPEVERRTTRELESGAAGPAGEAADTTRDSARRAHGTFLFQEPPNE